METRLLEQLIARLDKLDEKLDTLSEQMARYDERLQQGNAKFARTELRLDGLETRTMSVENVLAGMTGKSLVFERAGWIVFSAIAALLFKYGNF
jgi:hypothetical protein